MGQIACYCRVSTGDQNLDRQLERTSEYAQREFAVTPAELAIYRDKSTGTDIARSGYQALMTDVEESEIDAVVVHSISRICRSIRDLERTATRLEEANVELHIVSEGLTLRPDEEDPYQTALFQLLGVFAELEANMAQQRTKEGIAARMNSDADYHHGPAPIGFEKEDGKLIEADDYDHVVQVLEMKQKGNMGTREAARELDCGTATINRALDRAELYGLLSFAR
jgi:DNA invertase Pin-like site-specific DNA recombinase